MAIPTVARDQQKVDERLAGVRHALRYISGEDLKALHRIQPWRIAFDASLVWLEIIAVIVLWSQVRHPLVLLFAALVVATRQNALNNLVHDAAHFSISRRKRVNDFVSDAFFAAPHLISTIGYRGKHSIHHVYLGKATEDPEFRARFVIKGARFAKFTLESLLGVGFLRALISYIPTLLGRREGTVAKEGAAGGLPLRYYSFVLGTQAVIFAGFFALGIPFGYLYLWLLPLFTLALYLNGMRVIAEHQPFGYADLVALNGGPVDIRPPFTRTIEAGPIERFLFAPMNFCFHLEHHLFPGVPYTQLPRLHKLLVERGYYRDNPRNLASSYSASLKNLVFQAS